MNQMILRVINDPIYTVNSGQLDWSSTAQQQAKLDSLFSNLGKGEVKYLNILLKADVQGSLEAIKDALMKLAKDNEEVDVRIIGSGVGGINETDISRVVARRIAVSNHGAEDLLRAVAYAYGISAADMDKATMRHEIQQSEKMNIILCYR